MKKASSKRKRSLEEIFPNRAAREAADAAIDELSTKEPMTKYLDVWEGEYFHVAKRSPFRGKDF